MSEKSQELGALIFFYIILIIVSIGFPYMFYKLFYTRLLDFFNKHCFNKKQPDNILNTTIGENLL
jgi:hypothetical protein